MLCDQTHSHLKVKGNKILIDSFVQRVTLGESCVGIMGSMVPMPALIPDNAWTMMDKWQKINWGAEFGDYDTEIIEHGENYVIFDFWSYFSPLLPGLARIAFMYPTLTLSGSYSQLRDFMYGSYRFEKGVLSYHHKHSLETDRRMRKMAERWDEGGEEKWVKHTEKVLSIPGKGR